MTNCMGWGEGDDRIKVWGGFATATDAHQWVLEVASGWRAVGSRGLGLPLLQSYEVLEVFPYDQTMDGGDR